MEKLKEAITLLASESPLPARYRDHALIGNYQGHRECHKPCALTQKYSIGLKKTGKAIKQKSILFKGIC